MAYDPRLELEANVTASTFNATKEGSIKCDCTSNNITVTLPDATQDAGAMYRIKKSDSSANTVTVATTSSQTIDGVTTKSLAVQYAAIEVFSNGTNWSIVATYPASRIWSTVTSNTSAAVGHGYVVDATSSSFSVFFPSSATMGDQVVLKLKAVGSNPANTLTIVPWTTIDGNSTSITSNRLNDAWKFEYDGSAWYEII